MPIFEAYATLATITTGLSAATSALNRAAQAGSDLEQIGGYLTQLAEGSYDLQRLQNSKTLSTSDAIKATLAKKEADDALARLKDMFTLSGNGDLWAEAMVAVRDARVARQEEIKRLEKARKERLQLFKQIALVFVACVVLVPAVVATLLMQLT